MSSLKDTVSIRKALIEGFFMNAAEYQKENEYKTVRRQPFFPTSEYNYFFLTFVSLIQVTTRQLVYIHPSSVLFNSKPACVLYNELVKTNKTYLRDVSVLSANWLLEANPVYFKSKLRSTEDNLNNFKKMKTF